MICGVVSESVIDECAAVRVPVCTAADAAVAAANSPVRSVAAL